MTFPLMSGLAQWRSFCPRRPPTLTTSSRISDEQLNTLHEAFVLSMENAYTVFGKHAFRKWFADDDVLHPVNRSLFDVWSVEFSATFARLDRRHGGSSPTTRADSTHRGRRFFGCYLHEYKFPGKGHITLSEGAQTLWRGFLVDRSDPL